MKKWIGICFVTVVCLLSVNVGGYTEDVVGMDDLRMLAEDWLDLAFMDDFGFLAAFWGTDQTLPDPNVHWAMEETSGETIADEIGTWPTDASLTAISGYSITNGTRAGRVGNALYFIDDNDAVELKGRDSGQPAAILDVWPDEVTIMGWVRPMPGGGSDDIWFSKLQTDTSPTVPNSHSELYLRAGTGSNKFAVAGRFGSLGVSTKLTCGFTTEVDVWYHYAFTWDADGMALYIDGELRDTDNSVPIASFIDHDPDNGGYDLTIGTGWAHVYAFTGMIDEVKVYQKALSAWQIKNVYDATPPLVLYELIVNSGTGGGNYLNEVVVDIAADAPPEGEEFVGWTGDTQYVANASEPNTTVNMPAVPVTLTATYLPGPVYTLTVEGGTGSGSYIENDVVDIAANVPEGLEFDGWTGDTANVADTSEPNTTITMPGQDATVTATYALGNVGLAAWWEMEETEGTVSYDSNSVNDLVSTSGFDISASTRAGRIGNCFKFIDDNDRLTLPGLDTGDPAAVLDIFPDAVTIMGWIRPMPGGGSDDIWLSKLPTDNSPTPPNLVSALYLRVGNDFYVNGKWGSTGISTKLSAGMTVQDDVWYHYAFTWDTDGMALYIDGELKDTDNSVDITTFSDHDPDNGGYPVTVGSGWVHVYAFTGMIDDVRIYESALTAAQIKSVYDVAPPLVLYDLTVNSGTGSGSYLNEVTVDIAAADPPQQGEVFLAWTGDTEYVANVADPTTTVNMPAGPVTVTATYHVPEVMPTLRVVNGTGSGVNIPQGTIVDIVADTPDANDVFTGWTGDITNVADANAMATTITMPGVDTTVTATYANNLDMLIAHFQMEETSGADANDIISGYKAIPKGGMTIASASTAARIDNGFNFVYGGSTSTAQRMEVPDLLDVWPDELTIMGWVRPTTGNGSNAVWFGNWQTDNSVDPGVNISKLWLRAGTGSLGLRAEYVLGSSSSQIRVYSGVTCVNDTWYHVAFTWDADGMKLYVDGELKNTHVPTLSITDFADEDDDPDSYELNLGASHWWVDPFTGTMDDVRVYESALTAAQVKDIYDAAP